MNTQFKTDSNDNAVNSYKMRIIILKYHLHSHNSEFFLLFFSFKYGVSLNMMGDREYSYN